MDKLLLKLEKIFTIAALMHFSEGIIPLVLSGGASEGDGAIAPNTQALNAGLFLLIYLITYALLFLRWKRLFHALTQNVFLCVLIGIVGCSFLWSLFPDQTLVESIRFISASGFGLYFATRYRIEEQLEIFATLCTIMVVTSVIFILLPPRYGVMGGVHAGAFRGIYVHKNHFGLMMALSSVIFLIQFFETHKQRFKLLVPFSLALAVLSKSSGAVGVALIALMTCCFVYAYKMLRLKLLYLVPLFLFGLTTTTGFFAWAINNLTLIANATGEDLTLTGRTIFWALLVRMVQERPWLGYGYKGFWNGLEGPSRIIIQVTKWPVPEAHNGFLETAINVGLIGLGLFLITYALTMFRAVYCLHREPKAWTIWPIAFLVILVVCNLTESSLLSFGFFWLIFSSIVFSLPIKMQEMNLRLDLKRQNNGPNSWDSTVPMGP